MKRYKTFDMIYTSLVIATRVRVREILTGKKAANLHSAMKEAKAAYDAAWVTFENQLEGNK